MQCQRHFDLLKQRQLDIRSEPLFGRLLNRWPEACRKCGYFELVIHTKGVC